MRIYLWTALMLVVFLGGMLIWSGSQLALGSSLHYEGLNNFVRWAAGGRDEEPAVNKKKTEPEAGIAVLGFH